MYTNANKLNMKSRKMLYHDHVKEELILKQVIVIKNELIILSIHNTKLEI